MGQACESAAVRRVAPQFELPSSTVRAIDLRYLERWAAARNFISIASNIQTGKPLWFGEDRRKETLDGFFRRQLSGLQRVRIPVVCVDMWELEECAPQCAIVYDRFHVMQHANKAVDEVRRAEFFRQGRLGRKVIQGKRWLLLTR